MARGKNTCKILKEIRRQIAEANDISYVVEECKYKGDCLGTCPKCEAEVRYLEEQLHQRQLLGKAVMLAGLSAGMLTMSSCSNEKTITPSISENVEREVLGEIVERQPTFPGGTAKMMQYISENLKYPETCAHIEGRVVVGFVVNEDGSLSDFKVLRSVDPLLDAEALRVVKGMPNWIPGDVKGIDGKPAKVKYNVPITFKLAEDETEESQFAVPNKLQGDVEEHPSKNDSDKTDDKNVVAVAKKVDEIPLAGIIDGREIQLATYPGGEEELRKYISENLKYPDTCAQGRVVIGFFVNEDGSLSDFKVEQSVDPQLDAEALRLVNGMPKWIPGEHNGKPVRMKYSVPVIFKPL